MSTPWSGQVAVIADPHLHDTGSGRDYGLETDDCFRSLAQSAASTRVFNEGAAALERALGIVAERGVRLVMIAGDLTDDGQPANWRAATDLLHRHARENGTRFFLTPGNHDQWGGPGKPLTKGMVARDGTTFSLSGDARADAIHAPAMRQIGQAEVPEHAAAFGICRHDDDLLWETPFGASDALGDRIGTLTRPGDDPVRVPDLSYLVEPVAGLWILSVDANVYLPKGKGWDDCGKQGWNAVLAHKPWLVDWMADVAKRAREQGKRLLTMSHFPALDVLDGVPGGLAERVMPTPEVAEAMAGTGVGLHFSGHWHINQTGAARRGAAWLVNVAVPSTASFPPAFKLVDVMGDTARIETVALGPVPGFDAAFAHYRAERPDAALPRSDSYDAFQRMHLAGLVGPRYLARDWDANFVTGLAGRTLADVLDRAGWVAPPAARDIPARLAVEDYYFLERGGQLAGIPPARMAVYTALDTAAPEQGGDGDRRLVMGLARYSQGLPDDRFAVDLDSGRVTPARTPRPS